MPYFCDFFGSASNMFSITYRISNFDSGRYTTVQNQERKIYKLLISRPTLKFRII